MGLGDNSITIVPTTGYDASFSWQVGYSSSNIPFTNTQFRATIRTINGLEDYSRVPSNTILYEQTGIIINSANRQGQWDFPLSLNAMLTGGPYRDYQVVIEAHDDGGNTSAGNLVDFINNPNEPGWITFNQGYDIIAVQNPRQTGIELGNNIPTQYSIDTGNLFNDLPGTGFFLNSGNGYNSLNYMGTHGEINIRYLAGIFDSNLVGGYLYIWTGQFPKLETALGISGYDKVIKSQFSFDPTLGYIYSPTAAMAFRGANYVYVSVSFFDNIDKLAIDNGIDISTGLYVSDNSICYNDIAAGSISIGGFQTLFTAQYTGNQNPTGILGSGVSIISTYQNSGMTYVLYATHPITTTGISNLYTGFASSIAGGQGGNAMLLNYRPLTAGNGLIPIMSDNTTPNGTASASNNTPDAWRAFNGGIGTWNGSASAPQWLQYQFTTTHIVKSYDIKFFSDLSASYLLQGSNDGSTWTTMDSQISTNIGTFNISNNTSYSYYRLYVNSCVSITNPLETTVGVNTLQLYGI